LEHLDANVFYNGLIKSSGINEGCVFSPKSNVGTLDVTGACVNEQKACFMSMCINLKKWVERVKFLHYSGAIWMLKQE